MNPSWIPLTLYIPVLVFSGLLFAEALRCKTELHKRLGVFLALFSVLQTGTYVLMQWEWITNGRTEVLPPYELWGWVIFDINNALLYCTALIVALVVLKQRAD
jgi:ABC-type branched-subunit amino acid transport system permease subunit